jgi:hypothetical protein
MKKLPVLILLIFLFQYSNAQDIPTKDLESVEKLKFKGAWAYAYGPEVGLLLFPPIKFSLDYYFNKNRTLYVGLDGAINGFTVWGWFIGLQTGIQFRSLYVESGFDFTFFERGNYYSFNPKIGYDLSVSKKPINIYFETGPSFRLHTYERIPDFEYKKIGQIPLNFELGFSYRF